jgi:hypothetical protein
MLPPGRYGTLSAKRIARFLFKRNEPEEGFMVLK